MWKSLGVRPPTPPLPPAPAEDPPLWESSLPAAVGVRPRAAFPRRPTPPLPTAHREDAPLWASRGEVGVRPPTPPLPPPPQEACPPFPGLQVHAPRRVRFDGSAPTFHEIPPYSEVYGIHPRLFDFSRNFYMVPTVGLALHPRAVARRDDEDEDATESSDDDDYEWEECESA